MKTPEGRIGWLLRNIAFRTATVKSLEKTLADLVKMHDEMPQNNVYHLRVRQELEYVLQITKAEIAHVKSDRESEEVEIQQLKSGNWVVDQVTGFGRPR